VRLFYLRQYALAFEEGTNKLRWPHWPSKTQKMSADDAIVVATGLVNNVHIIKGTVAPDPQRNNCRYCGPEFVPFAVLKMPVQRQFMYRTYTDMQWRKLDMTRLDFAAKKYVAVKITMDLNVKDATGDFLPTAQ